MAVKLDVGDINEVGFVSATAPTPSSRPPRFSGLDRSTITSRRDRPTVVVGPTRPLWATNPLRHCMLRRRSSSRRSRVGPITTSPATGIKRILDRTPTDDAS